MQKILRKQLLHFKRNTISLSDLETLFPSEIPTYQEFAAVILALEKEGVLGMVKSRGRNQHTPSLAYHYSINKALLKKDYHAKLQDFRLIFHPSINLDAYFKLDEEVLEKDLPYLRKIDVYLKENGFPNEKVPAPERSFELVQNEKWIVEGRGSEVLHRIGLWDELKILPVSDPLMFALHPKQIDQPVHIHLIVENKTTYQALLPVLTETNFTTLIYGSGNKITKSIENFHHQLPIEGDHVFYYFGDLDRSGITIWHSLHKRQPVIPAYPFYKACLTKSAVAGKTNQRPNEQALAAFLPFFKESEQQQIQQMLENGAYLPQEVLQTKEIQQIWREALWKR